MQSLKAGRCHGPKNTVPANSIPAPFHIHSFVFLPSDEGAAAARPALIEVFALLAGLLVLAGFSGAFPIPTLELKTRFSRFLSLASLIFAAGGLYLEEFRVSLIRETRQKLHKALSAFDQGVEDTYLRYRSEFQKLRNHPMLKAAIANNRQISDGVEQIKIVLESFSPPLPWGALMLLNPEGKSVDLFRSTYHRAALAGYLTNFNRVGMLDAMRKGKSLPELADASSPHISDRDVAIKQAYACQSVMVS